MFKIVMKDISSVHVVEGGVLLKCLIGSENHPQSNIKLMSFYYHTDDLLYFVKNLLII